MGRPGGRRHPDDLCPARGPSHTSKIVINDLPGLPDRSREAVPVQADVTEQTTTVTDRSGSGDAPELSGVDLARVALRQARLAARNNGGEARAPRRRRATTVT
uniref:hypothetical protein n=1 Tax=Streptomyces sp. SAT1 TaxID=1849967 RepID=UPI0007F9FBFF|nr:hypothetical protein [Streptomyces sp. SAT1]ANO41884.1 hypothetical protein A8713_031975 [Streptomyces sp. SAT1]